MKSPAPLVPVDEVKAYLRIAGSEEDALIAGLVRSATELCEAFTRTALIERDAEEALPAQAAWARLSLAPVRAITGVAALGIAGDEQPMAAQDYAIDIDGRGEGWVRVPGRVPSGRVSVRYRAGLAAGWNGVPEPLRQGVVRLAAHFYAHRDGADGRGPPAAVTALWLPYRRLRLC
ncbi:MAG TPA: head-tail connector protein [Allosphingosinicella sp.]